MKWVAPAALALAAALWAWALWSPVEMPELPQDLVGLYEVTGTAPPTAEAGEWDSPARFTVTYELRRNGTYAVRRMLQDYEIAIFEGIASVADGNELTLRQMAFNRQESPPETELYRYVHEGQRLILYAQDGRANLALERKAAPPGKGE